LGDYVNFFRGTGKSVAAVPLYVRKCVYFSCRCQIRIAPVPPFPAAKSGGKGANQTDDVTVK